MWAPYPDVAPKIKQKSCGSSLLQWKPEETDILMIHKILGLNYKTFFFSVERRIYQRKMITKYQSLKVGTENRITRNSYRIVIATDNLQTLPHMQKGNVSTKQLSERHPCPAKQGDLCGAGQF